MKHAYYSKSLYQRGAKITQVVLVLVLMGLLFGSQVNQTAQAQQTITFTGSELLGRPTGTSITIKILPEQAIQYYYEYGTAPGSYTAQTAAQSATGGQPHQVTLSGLSPNTRYYYRMQYNYNNTGWVQRTERSFWTQRAPGASFTFTITTDSHVNIQLGNAATWQQTLNNVAGDNPDFNIDLGDTFAVYTAVQPGQVAAAETAYRFQLPYFNTVSHSASIFLAAGNHEQTEGWHRFETLNVADSLSALSVNAMNKFYLNPMPDAFYSGNTDTFAYIEGGLLGNYYAWEWGDALFVVIDPFWYTETKPYTGAGGGGEVNAGSGDRWDWTLGQGQFAWLKSTLENSDAPYKFVMGHHMVGGSQDYVRGGAVPAHLFEWGGYNLGGTTWGFDTRRAGWGEDPVHQIFIDNGVSAFFHGHDHEYAYEIRDGVVYQSLPAASFTGSFGIYNVNDPYTEAVVSGSGYLRFDVSASATNVEFVSSATSKNVLHTYSIAPNAPSESVLGDVNGDGLVGATDALIILSGNVGLDITSYCPINCGDVDGNGVVNATDALIILTYNVGQSVPFPVGQPGCPASITQPPGCTP